MKYQSRRLFVALILFLVVIVSFCLPDNLPVKFHLGKFSFNQTIHPLTIDLTRLNIPFKKTFLTKYGLDLSGGTSITLEADMSKTAAADRMSALNSAQGVIERRVNFLGVSEPIVQSAVSQNHYRIIVELPGVTNVEQAVGIIGATAQLEFREFDDQLATASATPSSMFAITKPTGITGQDLKRATVVYDNTNGSPQVGIEFTPDGGAKFDALTKRLVGKPLPIFLDDQLVSSPNVNQEISGGSGVISGSFTADQAKALALQLNAGALPVSIHVIQQQVVEASLGHDSITKSVRAGLIGLTLVAIFMILQYGRLGVISVFGLLSYGLINFALYRIIPVTLTLPGIAGFILSMGMAVDSNILIFERYKEEKRMGKPWKIAMEFAFGKAWDSIRDANVTTIITCSILFNPFSWDFLPSSGLVRGFALTLLVGVMVSLFTGLVLIRTFIRVLYRETSNV